MSSDRRDKSLSGRDTKKSAAPGQRNRRFSDTREIGSEALIGEISLNLARTAEEIVPWFVGQMPDAYFLDTDQATKISHLSAIIGARSSGLPLRLTLKSEDGSVWTFIHEGSFPGVLSKLLKQLPRSRRLGSAKVHSTADDKLVLDVFRFRDGVDVLDPKNPRHLRKREETVALAKTQADLKGNPDRLRALADHISICPSEYIERVDTGRIILNWRLAEMALQSDDVNVEIGPGAHQGYTRISLSTRSAKARTLFERAVAHLGRYQLNIHRAYLDLFEHGERGSVAVLGFVVHEEEFDRVVETRAEYSDFRRELRRLKWADSKTIELLEAHRDVSMVKIEVISALVHLVHAILGRGDSLAFSHTRLFLMTEEHFATVNVLAELFLARFDPLNPLDHTHFREKAKALRSEIEEDVQGDAHARRFLMTILAAVEASLRTNVFVEKRYALALRIDPKLMTRKDRPDLPFGVFFVHGRGFDGFHVRFRDVARGGVRVVRALGPGEHARESVRLYDETYDLAFAQQLKNKDIPEGGSKAVMLAGPDVSIERSVKAFVDSLLDLLSPDQALRENIVDLWGREELLYLGPDENISSHLIEWIVERAKTRGYGMPGAFMSSKPRTGINHKEYGVTSEGVTVFLEEALQSAGIDPRKHPFTVKITGGPDGDVAGNEIKILHREYGERAKIIGIADGSGSAEDPDGLAYKELLSLVARSAPIIEFDPQQLGPRGQIAGLDSVEGRTQRNTLHNRVLADAFIPAGGRPATIRDSNWRDFLRDDGKPSSRVIVEGANLFITPGARKRLSEAGTIVVKDSSANKCGVICSSYEIVASMILAPEEFVEIKEVFVKEVIDKLRTLARQEARLLFREHRRDPSIMLPELSMRISRAILRATDAIESALPRLSPDEREMMNLLVYEHLPAVVVARAGDRVSSDIPPTYRNGIVASSLASRIVYREGLSYLNGLSSSEIANVAVQYLAQGHETARLILEVGESNLPHRERISALLRQGGARAGVVISQDETDDS